jgi:ABC-type lipoprotein export system ATPase subunit
MKITFNKVVPEPIPQSLIASSKIWEEETSLASNDRILVQAQSGKGKSTLLHLIYGLRKDYSGSWEIDGVQAKDLSAENWLTLRAKKISLLFQDLRLFKKLSARENLELLPEINPQAPTVKEMCEALGILHLLDKPVETLSLGQRQRLALVRCLRKPFCWLLLDEPFSHLDEDNAKASADLIEEVLNQNRAGLVITSLARSSPFSCNRFINL